MADNFLIDWDKTGERYYENGVDHGILFIYDPVGVKVGDKTYNYAHGVAWNGLTAVNHSPEGADANDTYADNIKYISLRAAETFGYTIEALYSPSEFDECDGTIEAVPGVTVGQQQRKTFGFYHRSNVGTDTEGMEKYHKHHFIFGSTAAPSEHNYETVNDSPEPASLSWEVDTIPVNVGTLTIGGKQVEFKPTAKVTIDESRLDTAGMTKLNAILALLRGTKGETAETDVQGVMPLPADIISMMAAQG